jgi:hypothetical protein
MHIAHANEQLLALLQPCSCVVALVQLLQAVVRLCHSCSHSVHASASVNQALRLVSFHFTYQ